MPDVATERADLANLTAQLEDVRTLVTRLSEDATAATLDGDQERAEDLERKKMKASARMDTLSEAVERQRAEVAKAEQRERSEAAARHQRDKAEELHGIRSDFQSEASELIEAADAFLDRIQPALDLRDEHRAATAEIDVVDRLFPDVDRPDVPPFPEEEFEQLRGRVRELYARCETLARNYPRDARSGARGIMLERRRGDLFGDEPGMGRVYSRARGIRGLLSDETREVAEARIRERLAEIYEQVRPERRNKYREPGK